LTTIAVLVLAAVLAPAVATGPHLFDAGELAEPSVLLGGSHPPGQPVHAIASHPFLWIPLGTMAARLALFSLYMTLAAAVALAALIDELCEALGVPASAQRELAKGAAAMSLVLADPVLRQALRVEVYGLALALALSSIALLVRWARLGHARHLVAAALFAGLCAATHPPSSGMCRPRRCCAAVDASTPHRAQAPHARACSGLLRARPAPLRVSLGSSDVGRSHLG
jgi:hypothetical protein